LRHDEQAAAIAQFFPFIANRAFLFGVIIAPTVKAFVFDHQETAIGQFTHKIGIEPIRGGLQPEGMLAGALPSAKKRQPADWSRLLILMRAVASLRGMGGILREKGDYFSEDIFFI
jgi:hypothetical protein